MLIEVKLIYYEDNEVWLYVSKSSHYIVTSKNISNDK